MENNFNSTPVSARTNEEENLDSINKLRFQYDDYDVVDDTHLDESTGFGKNNL